MVIQMNSDRKTAVRKEDSSLRSGFFTSSSVLGDTVDHHGSPYPLWVWGQQLFCVVCKQSIKGEDEYKS